MAPEEEGTETLGEGEVEGAEEGATTGEGSKKGKLGCIVALVLVAMAFIGVIFLSMAWDTYADMPLIGSSEGRMKNAISTVVIGYAGRKIAKQHNKPVTIDMEIEKFMWPDAKVSGSATQDSAKSTVDLTFSTTAYTAQRDGNGLMRGQVDKADFDWKVRQQKDKRSKYTISRPGWNAMVKLKLTDNTFSGRFKWKLQFIDHDIEGSYNPQTHEVRIVIGGNKWFAMEKLTLVGTITPAG